MLILIVLLYFCVACSAFWLAFFPAGRQLLFAGLRSVGGRWQARGQHWQSAGQRSAADAGDGLRRLLRRCARFVLRHWPWAAGATAVVAIPSIIALMMSSPAMLPVYEGDNWVPDSHIAELLRGEQLVPPAALPPLVFTTEEVLQVRPMLVDASRNWTQMNPDFSQRLLVIFKIMKDKYGYDMALLEGYRSPERQNRLASMGASVTNAKAFQSYHQYGLAADCAFLRDGKLVISEKDPWAMRGYQLYGEVAESVGLTWGGRWKMMDFGHTELRLKGVIGH
ncbi:MAG: M15 family metallopeptidase [Gammaproteobacteria bacterium]